MTNGGKMATQNALCICNVITTVKNIYLKVLLLKRCFSIRNFILAYSLLLAENFTFTYKKVLVSKAVLFKFGIQILAPDLTV